MAYTIEEEQEINEIKSWWKENYKVVIAAVVLSLGGTIGWRYWQEHQVVQAQQLSADYDQIIYNYHQDPKQQEAQLNAFVQANGKTSYGVLVLLDKAKLAVVEKDYSQAEEALKQALANAPDDIFSSIIALRLAAVQFQQQQYDAALASLNQVTNSTWATRQQLLKGDILLAKGDKEGAKLAYQQAQPNATALEQQWIQVRLNNL